MYLENKVFLFQAHVHKTSIYKFFFIALLKFNNVYNKVKYIKSKGLNKKFKINLCLF